MPRDILQKLARLDIEEKILNLGCGIAIIGVFFPWFSGEWLGGASKSFSGFGFYTGFLGLAIFVINIYIIMITLLPLTGGPTLIKRHQKEYMRLKLCAVSTILTLSAMTVLAKITLDFARMQMRFGIYLTLIGTTIALLYAFLRSQSQRSREVHDLFHHTGDHAVSETQQRLDL